MQSPSWSTRWKKYDGIYEFTSYIYIDIPNKWGVLIELIHMQTLAMGSMTTIYLLNDGKFNNQGQGIIIARYKNLIEN